MKNKVSLKQKILIMFVILSLFTFNLAVSASGVITQNEPSKPYFEVQGISLEFIPRENQQYTYSAHFTFKTEMNGIMPPITFEIVNSQGEQIRSYGIGYTDANPAVQNNKVSMRFIRSDFNSIPESDIEKVDKDTILKFIIGDPCNWTYEIPILEAFGVDNFITIFGQAKYDEIATSAQPALAILSFKPMLSAGENTISTLAVPLKINVMTTGEKDVGAYLNVYKEVLQDVDSSEENLTLKTINTIIENY